MMMVDARLLVATSDEVRCLVQKVTWRSKEGDSNDDVEAEQHGALEIVGLAILDGVGDDQNGHGESDSLD